MTEWTGQKVRQLFEAAAHARAESEALIHDAERSQASVAHDRLQLNAARRARATTPGDHPADTK